MKGVGSITDKLALCKLLFLPHNLARKIFFGLLESLTSGTITIKENDQNYQFGERGELSATVTIHKKNTYSDLVFGGSLGAGEAFMRGDWTVDDLPALMRLFCRDLSIVNRLDSGLAMLVNPMLRFCHWLKRNTPGGARDNIHAHYDLGNEFFRLFLDETMMYSAAIFPSADSSLHEAQLNKLKIICDTLQLKDTDHLLEVGTGWGHWPSMPRKTTDAA